MNRVVHQNRMTKYFMRPEAKSCVETVKAPPQIERFEQQEKADNEKVDVEQGDADNTKNYENSTEMTIFRSPGKADKEAGQLLNGFKCNNCGFVAKNAAGLIEHRRVKWRPSGDKVRLNIMLKLINTKSLHHVAKDESRKQSGEMEVIQEIVVMNIPRRRNIRNVLHLRIKDRAAEEGMLRVLLFFLVVDGTHGPDHRFMCMENAMDNHPNHEVRQRASLLLRSKVSGPRQGRRDGMASTQ
ncbi:hypothetical protein BpHYR1_015118 [Brachionus plicatilis]|uniref:Uncharacterized protein n=1 Tax=Brachionus plicatilis TaxID=10195 RepID=A0A3M7S9T7_BRAPC|nr:hypothetical protein BpHYR1_015118 [Brachionus plicatilis]